VRRPASINPRCLGSRTSAFTSATIGQAGRLDPDRLEAQPHLDKLEHKRSDQSPHTDDENGGDHDGQHWAPAHNTVAKSREVIMKQRIAM
jgi:hypothetical protein